MEIGRLIQLFNILFNDEAYNLVAVSYTFRIAANVFFFIAFVSLVWQWQKHIFHAKYSKIILIAVSVLLIIFEIVLVIIFQVSLQRLKDDNNGEIPDSHSHSYLILLF